MTEDQLLKTIIDSSYLKADVLRRTRIVREYLEQQFYTPGDKKNLKDFLADSKASEADVEVIEKWGQEFFKSFTKENAYDVLEKVNAMVKDLPTMNLYVPVELASDETPKLGKWVRDNVSKDVLIELHVDSSTIGGCALAWDGVYSDYSLGHYLHKHVDGVRKVLAEYAQK